MFFLLVFSSTLLSPSGTGKIGAPTVDQSTSSISLNWTLPLGQVFEYKVVWNNSGTLMTRYTHVTFAVLSDLAAGTPYTITVIAVAGDNQTEGDPYTLTPFTSKSRPLHPISTPENGLGKYIIAIAKLKSAVTDASSNLVIQKV